MLSIAKSMLCSQIQRENVMTSLLWVMMRENILFILFHVTISKQLDAKALTIVKCRWFNVKSFAQPGDQHFSITLSTNTTYTHLYISISFCGLYFFHYWFSQFQSRPIRFRVNPFKQNSENFISVHFQCEFENYSLVYRTTLAHCVC